MACASRSLSRRQQRPRCFEQARHLGRSMQSCLANGVVSVHPPVRQMAQQAAHVVVREPITGALAGTMQCGGSNYRVWNSRKRIAAPRWRARCEYLRDGKATSPRDRVSGSSSSRANSAIAPNVSRLQLVRGSAIWAARNRNCSGRRPRWLSLELPRMHLTR